MQFGVVCKVNLKLHDGSLKKTHFLNFNQTESALNPDSLQNTQTKTCTDQVQHTEESSQSSDSVS